MTKRELLGKALEKLGYTSEVDDDGDLYFRYQMKTFFILVGDEDEKYTIVQFPQFAEVEEGEETLALMLCNKITRDIKLAKVYLDHTLKSISAGCEFYYTDEESLDVNLRHALNVLSATRGLYRSAKAEMQSE